MRHTRARTKKEAIVTAILEFNRRRRLERLAEKLGTFVEVMTQAELRRLRRSR